MTRFTRYLTASALAAGLIAVPAAQAFAAVGEDVAEAVPGADSQVPTNGGETSEGSPNSDAGLSCDELKADIAKLESNIKDLQGRLIFAQLKGDSNEAALQQALNDQWGARLYAITKHSANC